MLRQHTKKNANKLTPIYFTSTSKTQKITKNVSNRFFLRYDISKSETFPYIIGIKSCRSIAQQLTISDPYT